MIDFGQKLKTIREKLDLKQAAFAEKLGVKQSFYSLVETNKTSLPLTKSVVLFSELGVNPNWFFTPDEFASEMDIFQKKGKISRTEPSVKNDLDVVEKVIETVNSQQNTIEQLTKYLLELKTNKDIK